MSSPARAARPDPRITPTLPIAAGPGVDDAATSADVLVLFRYLVVILVVVGAMGVCVWARMAVRGTAVQLGAARSALQREETRQERLMVERSLLRDPGRLQSAANGMRLDAPAKVVTIGADGKAVDDGETP
jgi:cell division protein FtsL